ncbi:MAG: hypothetical protein KF799_02680 [Bdellovibrionales bacterium]|nr:hypothetical protein [Bdellovibrionales bacterium]
MSQYDTQSLHDFLFHTPEGGLRKMLIDRKHMTDVHCNLLLKIVKACNAEQFGVHLEKQDFPRIRMTPAEDKIKEKFWNDCMNTLKERGVLQPAQAQKVAA